MGLDNVYISDTADRIEGQTIEVVDEVVHKKNHKEEATKRKELDKEDRMKLLEFFTNNFHPLLFESDKLFHIVNGQCALEDINVANALLIGQQQMKEFEKNLPKGFHLAIERRIKTMKHMKKPVTVQDKKIYDMELIFSHLLLIGHQRNISLLMLFKYELSAVPLSIVDEFGFLRKGDKSVIVRKCLGFVEQNPMDSSIIIVDGSQLLFHTRWPIPGTGKVSDLVSGINEKMKRYPSSTEKLIIFDKYDEVSAKGHERQRRNGAGSAEYNLEINTTLPGRDTIMKNTANKQRLYQLLCMYTFENNAKTIGKHDCFVEHEEADIIMVSYLLEAAKDGKESIRVLSDDTDVFVLLVYWVWKIDLKISVQMEKWDGTILNINATVNKLGDKCRNILAVNALSGCDTVSYPFGK